MRGKGHITEQEKSFLKDFYHGEFTKKNFIRFLEIIKKSEVKEGVEEVFKNLWNLEKGISSDDGWETENRLNQLHRKINLKEYSRNKSTLRKLSFSMRRIAAVLFIPLLAASIYFGYRVYDFTRYGSGDAQIQISANSGSKTSFTLPDGTTGWLNSNSELSYRMGFIGGRKVNLKGEAYFEVTHNKREPFTVESPDASIEVLGTRFDVVNYPHEKKMEVILAEGSVACKIKSTNSQKFLKPNQMLSFNKQSQEIKILDVESFQYISWTKGLLILRDVSLAELIERINRCYDVDVEIMDKELMNYTFWGTFRNESVESIFNLLRITSPIKFEIVQRKLNDDNTYSKKKIKLYFDHNWRPKINN